MKTITHRRPTDSPIGDTKAACDFCGVKWHRSQLRMDTAGRLVCPQEGPGADELQLNQRVADAAARPRLRPRADQRQGGNYVDRSVPHPLEKIYGDDLVALYDLNLQSSQGSVADLTGNGRDASVAAGDAAPTYSSSGGPGGHAYMTSTAFTQRLTATGLTFDEGDRPCAIAIGAFDAYDYSTLVDMYAPASGSSFLSIWADLVASRWAGAVHGSAGWKFPTAGPGGATWGLAEVYPLDRGVTFYQNGHKGTDGYAGGVSSRADGATSIRLCSGNARLQLLAILSKPPSEGKRRSLRQWVAAEYPDDIDLGGRFGT